MSFSISNIGSGYARSPSLPSASCSAVTAGDFLFAVLGADGFSASAATYSGVSDNVNGAWTLLDNSGNVVNGGTNLSGAFAYFANSAAASSGLTVTMTGTPCPSSGNGCTIAVMRLTGAATSSPIIAHAINTNTTVNGSGQFTTPGASDTGSGDWVVGWGMGWDDWGPFTAGSGATLDEQLDNVGICHLTALSSSGSNTVNVAMGSGHTSWTISGTVIVAAGSAPIVVPRGPVWPQAMWRSAYRMVGRRRGIERPKLWVPPRPAFGGVHL
jgi:hypothetical protein